MVEYTTGMDTIRRLVKNNFVNELPDTEDKRAKILKLTKDGYELLKKANIRMAEEGVQKALNLKKCHEDPNLPVFYG